MRPLLILRPEPGASTTADFARTLGLEPIRAPLFAIRPLSWTAPDPAGFRALLLTSANAVRHGGAELDKLKTLPVYAVGESTAGAARAAGFEVAGVGDGGVKDVIVPPGDLLHLAGRHHRPLDRAQTIAVYESIELPSPAALSRTSSPVALVHSPRAGRRLAELAGERSTIAIAAISGAAAEACGSGWRRIEVAESPNDPALLALAARLCQDLPR